MFFFEYTKTIFSLNNMKTQLQYVLFSHANQSSIESVFSYVRSVDGDYPNTFGSAVGMMNYQKSMKNIVKNKCYEINDNEENAFCFDIINAKQYDKEVRKKVKKWSNIMKEKQTKKRRSEVARTKIPLFDSETLNDYYTINKRSKRWTEYFNPLLQYCLTENSFQEFIIYEKKQT